MTGMIDICRDGEIGTPHVLDLCTVALTLQRLVKIDMIQ
jgi:hypothetical protein